MEGKAWRQEKREGRTARMSSGRERRVVVAGDVC
jgi:hypothetical protein